MWTLRAGVFVLPLAYSPLTYDSYVLPKLLLARLLVAVLLVLFAAQIVATRTLVIKRTPLDIPIAAFLASAALSSVFAENQNVALFGTYARYDGLLTLSTFAALFWLCVQAVADQTEARVLIRVLLASGYVVAATAIIQSMQDTLQQRAIEPGAILPAFGSLGNPNVLGGFLALVIALGVGELLIARSAAPRIVLLNLLVVSGLALLLSFSRSAWLGAAIGTAVVVVSHRKRLPRLRLLAPTLAVLMVVLGIGYYLDPGQLEHKLVARMLTVIDPNKIAGTRFGIWTDSLHLIASRPVLGYGPDNVGLVYPRFQTGDWGMAGSLRQPIDKAHLELLQVAATQGLIGVGAYLFVLVGFVRSFWRARRIEQAVLVFAGWFAYQVALQLNFTALASALPFWIFAAVAMVSCQAVRNHTLFVDRRLSLVLAPAVAAAAVVTLWGVVLPYLADASLRDAVTADYAGRHQEAQRLSAQAQQLAPRESVYAVEVGNTAFEQDQWAAARAGYREAAALGTFNALVYRNLALADLNLGLRLEARDAARKAVELDRFDPANQALLAQFIPVKP
jgi:O-antigen ligase